MDKAEIDWEAEAAVWVDACHCGKAKLVHEDEFTRGLCETCDRERCDAPEEGSTYSCQRRDTDTVPNQPKTKIRSVRVPDERWEAAQKKAAEKGETVSDVINRALERYVKR